MSILRTDQVQTTLGKTILKSTGSILQVVQTVKTDTFATSSTTPVDITGLSVSITPSSASSKILVSWLLNIGGNQHQDYYLLRNGTKIFFGDLSGSQTQATHHVYAVASVYYTNWAGSGQYLDSPASTAAVTYKWQAAVPWSNTYTAAINYIFPNENNAYNARTPSSITVMEISA
jgi:hypothetical protein